MVGTQKGGQVTPSKTHNLAIGIAIGLLVYVISLASASRFMFCTRVMLCYFGTLFFALILPIILIFLSSAILSRYYRYAFSKIVLVALLLWLVLNALSFHT